MAAVESQTKAEKKAQKEVEFSGGNEYIGAIRENINKADDMDASGIDSALSAMDVGECCRARGGEAGGTCLGEYIQPAVCFCTQAPPIRLDTCRTISEHPPTSL